MPELERGGGDQARQLAGLEQVLHHQPLLARERAVVGARDVRGLAVLARQLVEPHRQPLGAAAVVHEHDRRLVRLHQLQQLGVDRGPDRAPGGAGLGRVARADAHQVPAARGRAHAAHGRVGHVVMVGLAHVLDRHADLQVERLAHAGVHDPAVAAAADEEAPDLLERLLGGGQADPLHVVLGEVLEALQRERQVRAALGARHGVDLVDDAPLDAPRGSPAPAR